MLRPAQKTIKKNSLIIAFFRNVTQSYFKIYLKVLSIITNINFENKSFKEMYEYELYFVSKYIS